MKINLTRDERTLIRKIARIQIQSFERLIENPSIEAQVRKAQYRIDEEFWEEAFIDALETWEELHRAPSYILGILDEADITTFKDIMESHCDNPYYDESISGLKWKLDLLTFDNQNLN
jgi:hypothetical protein